MKYSIQDVASVIRSKNSGPYELTLDIIFKDWEIFDKVCEKKIITPELISKLYKIDPSKVMTIVEFKPAKAIKITIERPYCSGAICESDVYGAQQHAPLFGITFDL